MAQGTIIGQSATGTKINGIIEEYKVASGGNVNTGDFVKFVETHNIGNNSINLNNPKVNAIALSENKILLYSDPSYGKLYCTICTISGNEITSGTETLIINSVYASSTKMNYVTILDENKFLVTYVKEYIYSAICTVSGNEITVHTPTKLSTRSTDMISETILLNNNRAVTIFSGRYGRITGIIYTISGNEIAVNSETELNSTSGNSNGQDIFNVELIEENKLLIVYRQVSYALATICTISDAEITAGSEAQLNTINFNNLQTILLNSNKFIVIQAQSDVYATIYSISNNAISTILNATKIISRSQSTYLNTLLLDENKFITVMNTNNTIEGIIYTISDTEITVNLEPILFENRVSFSNSILIDNNSIILINKNKFIIIYSQKSSSSSDSGSTYFAEFYVYGTELCVGSIRKLNTEDIVSKHIMLAPIEEKIIGCCSYTSSNKIIISIFDINKINKTNDSNIIGISKTDGTAGQTVKVIVPN